MPRSLNVKLPQLRAVVLAVHATLGLSAWALPQGATIVNGQVSVAQPTAGSQVIKASNGAIINWRQFSIGAGESTQFVQPSATSAVLNRVTGPDLSQLLGQLKANGQVFLINPHGIVIGGAARIDTNSFIASTLDISDKDFLSGKLRFFAGSAAGRIHNDGVITAAPGGRIALIAPDIENSGIIQAPDGQILLAAGRKLEIASMDLEGVTFQIQAPTDSVLNLGKLLAENGAVRAFAGSLRQGGEIRAGRLVRDGDGSIVLAGSSDLTLTPDSITRADGVTGGSIVLQSAHGTTRVSGDISATGSAGAGGDIRVLGDRVAVESGARIDASGSSGGGQILVGGDLQGKNPDVQNASRVYVAQGAQLKADATDEGNGGRVIVWADENTRYYGDLSAQGGAHGGNGGFAEVSGKTNLEFAGSANLGAPAGASGSLLLDPLDLIVSATSGILTTVVDEFADFIGNVVTVAPATLAAVAGNVILQAARDIYIKDEIALTTAGAGITMTAGGALFDAGTIFNNAGIRTNAGAVTLRAESIFGVGGVTSTGGAVDLLTSGILQYSGAINSGGGNVTLASTTGYVNSSDVNAGSGTIQVTGQTGVFNGSYTTTGTANLAATTGSVSNTNVSAAVVNLTAPSSIFSYVDVGQRVNATSTGSGVQIYANGANPLRLGTVAGSSIYLQSSTGMEQASGGLLTSSFVTLRSGSSSTSTGTAAAPILIASPSALDAIRLNLYDMAAPAHIAFSGSPTVRNLSLEGTVAALGGTTIGGAANLTSLSMNAGTGVLNVPLARSTGGLGFELSVTDGGLNATTLDLPGGDIYLDSQSSLTLGTVTSAYLNATARGAVSIGSITTTGNSGISVTTGQCSNSGVACTASSPITAGTLNAGTTGDVDLRTRDNGDITVSGSITARSVDVRAGQAYVTGRMSFFPFVTFTQSTTNKIDIASATTSGSFTATNNGIGDLTVRNLSASDNVDISAGDTYTVSIPGSPFFSNVRTTNNISVTNAEPVAALGNFQINNYGAGNVTLTGAVDRTASGSVNLSTDNGSVTATGNLAALYSISVTAGNGLANLANLTTTYYDVSVNAGTTLTVGQVTAGSATTYGNVYLYSGGDMVFGSVSADADPFYVTNYGYGSVNLSSGGGSIRTATASAAPDVIASGNVSIDANDASNGSIGNPAFVNPMDIKAGPGMVVTLSAGKNIGAPGKPVTVDTSGTLDVTSTDGQFHVAARDAVSARSLSTIRLSASADGIGSGNDSTFTSADLDVTASSNLGVITINDPLTGNLERSAGTLNEFKFAAIGTTELRFGNVNFGTAGLNKLILSATNGLTQTGLPANAITAGNVNLAGGGGDVTTGGISARSVTVSGDNLSLGSVTTTGTSRATNFGAVADALKLSSPGDILVTGNLLTATAIDVNSTGGGVDVTGSVTGTGATRNTFRAAPDQVQLRASGDITTGGAVTSLTTTSVVAGGAVDVGGAGVGGGTTAPFGNNLNDSVTVTSGLASSIDAAAITGGFTKTVTGGTLNVSGISGAIQSTTINGTVFNTGNISTGGALVINATAAYAPASAIALSGTGSVSIDAPGGIDLVTNSATLTSPTVTLKSLGGLLGGDVKAALTGTTNLTINTDHKFNVTSGTALTNLNVTADGVAAGAGAGSSVGAPGQAISVSTAGGAMAMGLQSATAVADRYTETSSSVSSIDINTTGAFGTGGSSINVSAPVANIATPSVTLANGSLTLSTSGDIDLTSVVTGGGFVTATSFGGTVNLMSVSTGGGQVTASTAGAAKDVNVANITSLGGSVSLTASNGSIVRSVGAAGLQIDTRNGAGAASGTTTLSAPNGSVGTAAAPILTRGALALSVRAKDEIEVDAGPAAALTNLSITAAATGTGLVNVANSNYAGLSVTRIVDADGPNLTLGTLTGAPGAFSLTATDGNIKVGGDISGVTTLVLNAGNGFNTTGDLFIAAGVGPRSVSAGSYDLRAGHDVLITAGATAADTVAVSQTSAVVNNSVAAGHDIVLAANGGSAVLSQGVSTFTQTLSAGHDLRVTGGSSGVLGASAAVTSAGFQFLTANNSLVIQGGASDGAFAKITAAVDQNAGSITNLSVLGGGDNANAQLTAGRFQNFTPISGDIKVLGGGGTNAFAEIVAVSTQSLGSTNSATDLVQVNGGTGGGAYASVRTAGSQTVLSSGDIRVMGGSGPGSNAELKAGTSQTIGNTDIPCCFFNDPTAAILVQAGSGGTARILAGGNQVLRAGEGISVLGGSGTGMSASIETTVGTQNIGTSSTNQNDPTGDILVRGGTATNAFASISAPGSQTINTGGTISVLGGSGPSAGAIPGAYAEIVSTGGGQTIGSTFDFSRSNDPTGSIVVRAGIGGIAQIKAQGNQTIRTSGDLSVIGGDGANLTASIESVAGFQTIGNTNTFRNDPSDSIFVTAGTATGAAAWIKAATGQNIDAGGTIALRGGPANAFAEISTAGGSQSIGNQFGSDPTDSISLTGGTAGGSYAMMSAPGSQTLRTAGNLSLTGGAGDNSGALLLAGTGQSLEVSGNLTMLGGSGSAPGRNETAIRNTSGSQFIDVGGDLRITGGGFGADTWIKQNGAATQDIMVGGNLALLAPAATPGTGVTSIEALAGGQDIRVGRAMSIDNQGGWLTYVTTTGTQDIAAQSLAISLSSTNGTNPFAGLSSIGDMSINLSGDGSLIPDPTDPSKTIFAPSATLTVANFSPAAGSLAAIKTSGNLSILMDYQQGRFTNYDAAGKVTIGDVNGQGAATVSAGGDLTIVAGQLLLQGGTSAASDAKLLSGDQPSLPPTGTMTISTLYGPVEMLGGAGGGAYIDPLFLDVVSNGAVLMQAGTNSTANTNITAGTFNLAATTGALGLYNSTTSSATSTITASNFNFSAVGTIVLNGGTITATNGGTFNSNVVPPGIPTLFCVNCATNLFGLFFFGTGASGSPLVGVPQPPVPQTGPGSIAAGDIAFLGEFAAGLFDLTFDESGNLVTTRRRLNQCY